MLQVEKQIDNQFLLLSPLLVFKFMVVAICLAISYMKRGKNDFLTDTIITYLLTTEPMPDLVS